MFEPGLRFRGMRIAFLVGMLPASALAAAAEAPPEFQLYVFKLAAQQVVHDMNAAADAEDWASCQANFNQHVELDLASMELLAPARISSEQLCKGWAATLGVNARTNYSVLIDGGSADVQFESYAWKRHAEKADPAMWGIHHYSLVPTALGWKIEAFAFRRLFDPPRLQSR